MRKWFKISLIGLLVFGAIAALVTGVALAQEETPQTPETVAPHPWGRGFGRGLGGEVGLQAAAEALGMSVDELSTQLWGGKTLADLAEEKGLDLAELQATVKAAVQAERETAMRATIEQALENGTITQEHADWLLEGLEKGFLMGGFGFGPGFGGRGGFHGHGFKGQGMQFGAPQVAPSSGA
ncbi:MAG TPA: hypothetical protein VLA49_15265 [Anaerolineales bacterium]|nr:hypothetical protein [Anaerolineales bacterium]